MPPRHIVILGGGFGGLAAATRLRSLLPREHRITLVERQSTFSMGLSNLWVLSGERPDPTAGERRLNRLAAAGVEYTQAEITSLDAATRSVQTSAGTLGADYLVIALGAELAPATIPGFTEAAHNLYDMRGAMQAREALLALRRGKVAVLISRMPFKCPPAPYEAALITEALLRRRGVRPSVDIALYTAEPQPMPIAGKAVGDQLRGILAARGIAFHPSQPVQRIDPVTQRIHFESSAVEYDLLLGVPPHAAPAVVRQAGLTDASGWIPADPLTLRTQHAGVYALGDVAAIRLQNGMLLPKAGVLAEGQAHTAAAAIAAEVLGQGAPPPFDGRGVCWLDLGDGLAAQGAGKFYATPSPQVALTTPSAAYHQEKIAFERTRLERWFAPS